MFHLCIETVIVVPGLIVKREDLGAPSDEEHVIDKLVDADIFDSAFGETLKDLKRFHNVLAHRYGEIDDRNVYEQLDQLEDFDTFRRQVSAALENSD